MISVLMRSHNDIKHIRKTVEMLFTENTELRQQLRQQTEQNSRLREALTRQSMDNYEYE